MTLGKDCAITSDTKFVAGKRNGPHPSKGDCGSASAATSAQGVDERWGQRYVVLMKWFNTWWFLDAARNDDNVWAVREMIPLCASGFTLGCHKICPLTPFFPSSS